MGQSPTGTPGSLGYDSGGNLLNSAQPTNFLLAYILGALQRLTGGGSGGGIPVPPATGALTDASGTIAAGGTAQTLLAAATRQYLFIQNNSAEALWFNYGVAAVAGQPSIMIAAGLAYESPSQFVSNQSISIIGATTGDAFTCKWA